MTNELQFFYTYAEVYIYTCIYVCIRTVVRLFVVEILDVSSDPLFARETCPVFIRNNLPIHPWLPSDRHFKLIKTLHPRSLYIHIYVGIYLCIL